MQSVVDDVQPMSDMLRPKPLGKDAVAVFKLCSVGKREYGREEPSAPEVYQLAEKERIIDPFVKTPGNKDYTPQSKTIGTYVLENKMVGNVMKAIYKKPVFIRGYCVVGADEQDLFAFLMRSKKNRSNKFRGAIGGKKTTEVFMLVEDLREVGEQLHLEDLRFQAETIVRTADWTKLKAICNKLNQSPDKRFNVSTYQAGVKEDDLKGMKLELINKAKLYPKQVIYASDDPLAVLTVQIHEAMQFSVLQFEGGEYSILTEKNGVKGIFTPDKDDNPIEALTKYLMSDEGNGTYKELMGQLRKALKG